MTIQIMKRQTTEKKLRREDARFQIGAEERRLTPQSFNCQSPTKTLAGPLGKILAHFNTRRSVTGGIHRFIYGFNQL